MGREYNPKPLVEETEQNLGNRPVQSTQPYETPLFKKQTTMSFPEKILEKLNEGRFPQAINLCSRCHHCR